MVQDNRGKISSPGAVQERYKFVSFLRIPMASLQGSAVATFHGGNTGSNPVGDAKPFQSVTQIFSEVKVKNSVP